jgi:hypothetical protein
VLFKTHHFYFNLLFCSSTFPASLLPVSYIHPFSSRFSTSCPALNLSPRPLSLSPQRRPQLRRFRVRITLTLTFNSWACAMLPWLQAELCGVKSLRKIDVGRIILRNVINLLISTRSKQSRRKLTLGDKNNLELKDVSLSLEGDSSEC